MSDTIEFEDRQPTPITDWQTLEGHTCEKIAELPRPKGDRELWLGKLTRPIKGYPKERYCLHVKTPKKKAVFGLDEYGDPAMMMVFARIALGGPVNDRWIEKAKERYKV